MRLSPLMEARHRPARAGSQIESSTLHLISKLDVVSHAVKAVSCFSSASISRLEAAGLSGASAREEERRETWRVRRACPRFRAGL